MTSGEIITIVAIIAAMVCFVTWRVTQRPELPPPVPPVAVPPIPPAQKTTSQKPATNIKKVSKPKGSTSGPIPAAVRPPIPKFTNGHAVGSTQPIFITYKDRHNNVTQRTIEPHSVQAYLDIKNKLVVTMILAYCHREADWRTFRPDRIKAMVSSTGETLSNPQKVFAPAPLPTEQLKDEAPPDRLFSLRDEAALNGIAGREPDGQVEEA